MTPNELRNLANILESESKDLKNFNNNDSVLNFDSDFSFNAEYQEYGHAYTGRNGIVARGQTTYDLIISHDNAVAVSVPIQLFESYFNTGTFVGNNLTFTSGGATVTIQGMTAPFKALMNRSQTQPFRINFMRMLPQAASQLSQGVTFKTNSVWGASKQNNLTPNTYIDPNQYQLLRVDVPANFIVDGERGIEFSVNAGEEIAVTLFIDQILDQTKSLQGENPVRNLGHAGITAQPPRPVSIRNVISSPRPMGGLPTL